MVMTDRGRCGTAALKYYLCIKLSCFYFVCFEKADGEKRDLFRQINLVSLYSKSVYKRMVNWVRGILETKYFQGKFPEAILRNGKYRPFTAHYRQVSVLILNLFTTKHNI
jgi:hypothetical protein